MKLRRLYSNQPDVFRSVDFRDGLNVVVGEIRRPENREKDTHNLGKTLLGQVIDFCLLRQKDKRFFLFAHPDLFEAFVFFLEVETPDGTCVTVRRSVEKGSKASFMRHEVPGQDFSNTPKECWHHWELSAKESKRLLDGLLGLTALSATRFGPKATTTHPSSSQSTADDTRSGSRSSPISSASMRAWWW